MARTARDQLEDSLTLTRGQSRTHALTSSVRLYVYPGKYCAKSLAVDSLYCAPDCVGTGKREVAALVAPGLELADDDAAAEVAADAADERLAEPDDD